jgi:hypothetical protein
MFSNHICRETPMLDFLCSTCGKRSQADEPIVCPDCNRAMTAVAAIATPEDAGQAKITQPTVAGSGAFSEGLPPYEPEATPSIRKELPSLLARWLPFVIAGGVGLLCVALIVPAVQKVREADARTHATCNLKNIGLSAHSFHDANKRLPFNGSSVAVNEVAYSVSAAPSQSTSGSWGFQISPFIDQQAMFVAGTSNTGIAAFMCPGRSRPSTTTTPGVGAMTPPWSDYVINPWLNDPKGGGGITTTNAVRDNRVKLADITDGTSNTIFFGHGQINTADYATTVATPGYMDTILIGGTTVTALSSNPAAGPVTFARDSADTRKDAARGWGGPFSQGCLIGMGDATVRMFPYSMAVGSFNNGQGVVGTFSTFLTPAGNEAVVLPDT